MGDGSSTEDGLKVRTVDTLSPPNGRPHKDDRAWAQHTVPRDTGWLPSLRVRLLALLLLRIQRPPHARLRPGRVFLFPVSLGAPWRGSVRRRSLASSLSGAVLRGRDACLLRGLVLRFLALAFPHQAWRIPRTGWRRAR